MKVTFLNCRPGSAVLLAVAFFLVACGGGGDSGSGSVADYTLAGTVSTSPFYAVDGDVNDPNAPYTPNDALATAQTLFFPVTLAGYVNFPGQGSPGRSFASGDEKDFYRITLSAGNAIILYIASGPDTDLDLFLYRADDLSLADASMGVGTSESLRAPENGEFIIEVRIVSDAQPPNGASNYNLIVGDVLPTTVSSALRLSHDFIPGEVVVRFADGPTAGASVSALGSRGQALGMKRIRGSADREMLFAFEAGEQTRTVFHALGIQPPLSARSVTNFASDSVQHKIDTLNVIKALSKREDVRSAAPNFIRRSLQSPNDIYFDLQWNYELIQLPQAWENETGSGDVVVAVIDTGVLFEHPDLGPRLTDDGYDFVSSVDLEGAEPAAERGGIDPNPDDPGDQATGGSSFHGTHVAGTVAAATDNRIGVAGAGWNAAKIMAVRALGLGGVGTSYDIMQAVRYAAGLANDSGSTPQTPADIINLSIGGGGFSAEEAALYTTVSQRGIIVVSAAGNQASNEESYPAAYESVVAVSALDASSNRAYYSNFGAFVDVAAPGGDNTADLNSDGYPDGILSTIGDDTSGVVSMGYGFSQGTSMATPHVAGVAALMKTAWPQMTSVEFDNLLRAGQLTTDLGEPGKDDIFGYGMIDARKAVLAAQTGVLPTAIIVSPPVLRFGSELSELTFRIEQTGDPDAGLAVTAIEPDTDWIRVNPSETDDSGIGSYTVSVDRDGLEEGVYNAGIDIASTANSVTVPVSMQVKQPDRVVSAGHHYVLLLDPTTYETLVESEASLENGVYRYRLSGVAQGTYLLYAGSDMDNDAFIGDVGNAIGAYLSMDQPVVLTVDQDDFELNFKTEFNINLFDAGLLSDTKRHAPIVRRADGAGKRGIP